jgi:NAD(P)-dependent dehydrogenase (short-subunit alcohol dehydrogenase family)
MEVSLMAVRLSGITALVTGANRGIGLALVQGLLERGAARVYAGARTVETLDSLVAAAGGRVIPIQLDVTSPEQIQHAAAVAGDVQLLINNAGVAAQFGGTFDDPRWVESARREYEVNVIGTLAVTQAFAPVLARNGGGGVVNLSSVVALATFPMALSYSASKAANHSLTQATRAMLRPRGTFVAGVYPGPIDTDMASQIELAKTPPAVAAAAILDGVEAGQEEIFPDVMARQLGDLFLRSPKELEQQFSGVAA